MAKIADARTVLRGLAALSGQYPAFVVGDAAATRRINLVIGSVWLSKQGFRSLMP
jgi:hypothetical protein